MLKVAACLNSGGPEQNTVASRMLDAQRLRDWQRPYEFTCRPVSIAWCSASPSESLAFWARTRADGSLLLVSGVPICRNACVDTILANACDTQQPELLTGLDGAFVAVFWNARTQQLTTVTDFLGLHPLYMSTNGGRLLLSSEMKGIAAGMDGIEMDIAGWGGFITMGHTLGDSTTISGVRRVPAASVITWDGAARKVEERRYWRGPEVDGKRGADAADVVSCLQAEVREYVRYRAPGTVLLSGGFDSRLILCLLRGLGHCPDALGVRHASERLDADGKYARAVAEELGVRWIPYAAPRGYYNSSAYLDYLEMQECANPTLGLFIAQVSAAIQPALGAVWEGVAPGYTLAFPRIRRPDLQLYLKLRCQAPSAPAWNAARMVFRRAAEMQREFELRLAAEAKECSDGDAGLLRFEARHQMRNRMGHNPLKVYSNDVPCFTPGTSREFWNAAASIPYTAKWNFRLYFDIFRKHFPEALAVPFCSMGQMWSDRFRADAFYHAARLFPPPGAQAAARLLRRAGLAGSTPVLVQRVVSLIDPEHPDLQRDAVAGLQRQRNGGEAARQATRLLFYWQVWRWIMEGRLQSMRPALVGEARL